MGFLGPEKDVIESLKIDQVNKKERIIFNFKKKYIKLRSQKKQQARKKNEKTEILMCEYMQRKQGLRMFTETFHIQR